MQSIIEAVSVWLASFLVNSKYERSNFIGEYDNIHVRQEHNWDCGVACLHMSLRWWFGDKVHDQQLELDSEEYEGKESPLWTIDIFLSLIKNGADDAVMFTTCKGIDGAFVLQISLDNPSSSPRIFCAIYLLKVSIPAITRIAGTVVI